VGRVFLGLVLGLMEVIMRRQGMGGKRAVLGLGLLLLVLSGCAEGGRLVAKMHGLEVVSADDCRHFLHTTPCKTVEPKP
jgi:hypothetical protein